MNVIWSCKAHQNSNTAPTLIPATATTHWRRISRPSSHAHPSDGDNTRGSSVPVQAPNGPPDGKTPNGLGRDNPGKLLILVFVHRKTAHSPIGFGRTALFLCPRTAFPPAYRIIRGDELTEMFKDTLYLYPFGFPSLTSISLVSRHLPLSLWFTVL